MGHREKNPALTPNVSRADHLLRVWLGSVIPPLYLLAALYLSTAHAAAGFILNPYRFAGAGSSFLVNQNFEGTGYDNGETWTEAGTGTVDEDHTGTVIAGSQSLQINLAAQTGSTSVTFTAQGTLYTKFQFRVASTNSGNVTIATIRNGSTTLGTLLLIGANRTLRAVAAGGSNASASATIALNTNIFIWFEYVKGSGSNAICRAGWATTDSKPALTSTGAQTCLSSNGTSTSDANTLYLGHTVSGTYEAFFDVVQASASAF
jgi:hypothetical protein